MPWLLARALSTYLKQYGFSMLILHSEGRDQTEGTCAVASGMHGARCTQSKTVTLGII